MMIETKGVPLEQMQQRLEASRRRYELRRAQFRRRIPDRNCVWLNSPFPFTEEKIQALKVGDEVLISGVVFTKSI